jgi:hypothetical protein
MVWPHTFAMCTMQNQCMTHVVGQSVESKKNHWQAGTSLLKIARVSAISVIF